MIDYKLIVVAFLVSFAAAPAWSQANDIAAERSRVANERIRIEAERIAEEERRRAADAEAQSLPAPDTEREAVQPASVQQAPEAPDRGSIPAAAAPGIAAPRADGQTDRLGMSRMLEHLRVLGQLRKASYVTEEEFERIKERILDGEL